MSSNRQVAWSKGFDLQVGEKTVKNLESASKTVDGITAKLDNLFSAVEKLLDVASVFVGTGSDITRTLLSSYSSNLTTVLKDIKSMGGSAIFIHPLNRKNKQYKIIGLQDADATSEELTIPLSFRIPTMTVPEGIKELRQAMFNRDPKRPQWTANVKSQGYILILTVPTPSNFGNLLTVASSFFSTWPELTTALESWKELTGSFGQMYEDIVPDGVKTSVANTKNKTKTASEELKAFSDPQKNKEIQSLKSKISSQKAKKQTIEGQIRLLSTISPNNKEDLQLTLSILQRESSGTTTLINPQIVNVQKALNLIGSSTLSAVLSQLRTGLFTIDSDIQNKERELAGYNEYIATLEGKEKAVQSTNAGAGAITANIFEDLMLSPDVKKFFSNTDEIKKLGIAQLTSDSGPQWFGASLGMIPVFDQAIELIERVVDKLNATISGSETFLKDLIKALYAKISILKEIVASINKIIKGVLSLRSLGQFYIATIPADFGGTTQMIADIEKSMSIAQTKGLSFTFDFSALLFLGWSSEANTEAWANLFKDANKKFTDSGNELLTTASSGAEAVFDSTIDVPACTPYPALTKDTIIPYNSELEFTMLCPRDSSTNKIYWKYTLKDNKNRVVAEKTETAFYTGEGAEFEDDRDLLRTNKKVKFLIKTARDDIKEIPEEGGEFSLDVTVFRYSNVTLSSKFASESYSYSFTVKNITDIIKVKIVPKGIQYRVGGTDNVPNRKLQFTAEYEPSYLPASLLSWTTSDSDLATVSSSGEVTLHRKIEDTEYFILSCFYSKKKGEYVDPGFKDGTNTNYSSVQVVNENYANPPTPITTDPDSVNEYPPTSVPTEVSEDDVILDGPDITIGAIDGETTQLPIVVTKKEDNTFEYQYFDPITATWSVPTIHQIVSDPSRVSRLC